MCRTTEVHTSQVLCKVSVALRQRTWKCRIGAFQHQRTVETLLVLPSWDFSGSLDGPESWLHANFWFRDSGVSLAVFGFQSPPITQPIQ